MNLQQGYRALLKSAHKATWKSRQAQKQLHRLIRNDFDGWGQRYASASEEERRGICEEFGGRVEATVRFHSDAASNGTAHKVVKNITDIYHSHTSPKTARLRRKTVAGSRWNAHNPPVEATAPRSSAADKARLKYGIAVRRMHYINGTPLFLGELVSQAEHTSGVMLGRIDRPPKKLPE